MRHLKGLLSRYHRTAATPFNLQALALLENDDWGGLVRLKADPAAYTNSHSYLLDAQCAAFYSHNESVDAGVDTRAEAKKAWWEAEHRCARTNAFINALSYGSNDPRDEFAFQYLCKVRAIVRRMMGSVPLSLTAKFGPGSTLSCHAGACILPFKIESVPTTTKCAAQVAAHFLSSSSWFKSLLERKTLVYEFGSLSGWTIVRSSRWSSVPKNAKTDRSIEIGADINVALQLDVGAYLTKNLASFGWVLKKDLWTNVQDLHKQVACDASKHGFYATIDLKQASDSMARELVKFLVTPDWYSVLDTLRSRYISIDGQVVALQKFSGMGNGYTFELESIIFAAFTAASMEDAGIVPNIGNNFFVFGDDIIVPSYCSRLLIASLRRYGFETNVQKTFVKGPFRESCGGDYFRGVDVRPFFLKESPNEPAEWIAFANGVRRMGYDKSTGDWRDPAYRRLWLGVLDSIPKSIRDCRGPSSLGDLVIHDERENWITRTRHCIQYVRTFRPVISQRTTRQGGPVVGWGEFPESVILATRLYSFPRGQSSMVEKGKHLSLTNGIVPRSTTSGRKVGWTPCVG